MLTGQQIDQYLIQNLLARGGMAEVYLARDITLQRKIALKILLPELTSHKTAVARFHREARAVAQLNHPHIIQIYTIGTLPGHALYRRRHPTRTLNPNRPTKTASTGPPGFDPGPANRLCPSGRPSRRHHPL
jgi:serine/threonine protein kinase